MSLLTIARVGTPTTQRRSTATTTHTVAAPTGAGAGDTVVLGIVLGNGSGGATVDATMAAPTGWTLIAGPVHAGTGARNLRVYGFARVLDGGANDTFAGVSNVACESIAHAAAYENVDPVIVDVAAQGTYQGLSTGLAFPLAGVTTVTDTDWLVGFWALLTGSGTFTKPASMTQQATDVYSGGYRTALADEGPAAVGATGTRSGTGSSNFEWGGFLVALRPATSAAEPSDGHFTGGRFVSDDGTLLFSTDDTDAAWSGGFLRAPDGRLVATTSTTGAHWWGGFLRSPTGALVVDDGGSGTMQGGFVRSSTGALVLSTDAGTMHGGFMRDASRRLVAELI